MSTSAGATPQLSQVNDPAARRAFLTTLSGQVMRSLSMVNRVLTSIDNDRREEHALDVEDEASAAAVGGNPRRAHYLQWWADRIRSEG